MIYKICYTWVIIKQKIKKEAEMKILSNGNIDIEEFDGEKIFVITILKGEEK